MDLGGVEKKIREVEFFLDRLREFEKRMLPNREPFDFYLSALLGAGRAVDWTLRQEPWRSKWNSANGPAHELLRIFAEDRNVAVHEGGARDEKEASLALAKTQHQEGGATVTVTGPPGSLQLPGTKRDYLFKIDGVDHKVTDACAEYIKVLKRMAAQFQADHP
jgi:hypothetical protein